LHFTIKYHWNVFTHIWKQFSYYRYILL
jgi:hypothetical protein